MNHTDLPPLPKVGTTGPEVCDTMALYLAVWNDLNEEQRLVVRMHVERCPACTATRQSMNRATTVLAGLAPSQPSARVDEAVLAAIRARGTTTLPHARPQSVVPLKRRTRTSSPLKRLVAIAAAVLLLALGGLYAIFGLPASSTTSFTLPANLSWKGYVLYQQATEMSSDQHPYQVKIYYDPATGRQNVETVMDGQLDVVMVGDQHEAVGLDMLHHVAQMGAHDWGVDESLFNLDQLRHDLATRQAVYLGTTQFHGQTVSRIRCKGHYILLLDKDGMPVNVLHDMQGNGAGEPMYETLEWLPPSHVDPSMWNMSVPPGFHMGTLPPKP